MNIDRSIKILKERIHFLEGRKEWLENNLAEVDVEIEVLNDKIRELTANI